MRNIAIFLIKSHLVLNMKKNSNLNDLLEKVLILRKNLLLRLKLKTKRKILK